MENHLKLNQLSFFSNRERLVMFNAAMDFTVDSVVNFIENTLAQYSVQSIADEVHMSPSNVIATPCDNIIHIAGCGTANAKTATFSGSGSWSNAGCGPLTTGQEKIYSFTPNTTGSYSLVVTSANGYVDYFWSTSCSASGWTCISALASGGSYTIGNLTAGTTYYFLLDAEGTTSRTHSFYINCLNGNGSGCSGVLTQPSGCTDAEPFCTSDQYCFAASTALSAYGRIGCLVTTPGPAWYWMQIDQPGNLQIYIEQKDANGRGVDVDFIAWGPFNSLADACAQKQNISCSSNHNHTFPYPYGNIVDCCFCSLTYENLHINNAQTGQVYLLLLTNYDHIPANISFSKTGGTATTNCGIITPPADNNGPLCVGDSLQLTAQTSNIGGAIYSWTGPNGFTSNLQNPTINNVTTANAGIYTLIVSTTTETGTIETTEVVINVPSDTTFIDDQICTNVLPYVQNGFNVSTAGVHYLNLTNVNGCDSIITLNLTVNQIYNDTVLWTICAGDSYYYTCGNCPNFANLPAGNYFFTDTLQTMNNCDSVVTLNLTVNPLFTKTIDKSICATKSYDFYGTIITNAGTYTDTVAGIGCDTIVTLNLSVIECTYVQIDPPGEICADDDLILLSYSISDGNLTCYSVTFNSTAIQAGFVNIPCQNPASSTHIEVLIPPFPSPQYVRPDNYSMTIEFELLDGTIESRTFDFTVLYPSWIMEQEWNDVVALQNNRYNGGYRFSFYEWYLDDRQLTGENNSFIYIKNGGTLEMGHEYRALLTREGENSKIFTCPLIPQWHTDVTLYPTIVGAATRFSIVSKNAVKVTFYTVTGIKLSEYQLIDGKENSIYAPYATGVYIIVFENKNGMTEAGKIVVK
ncbi:MAG: hypothetical protein LBT04_08975 [Prevotellaceae bacterium]|nr:hypothetical protein [Prevotellaceae bacterium]